eukprot:2294355-Heterocapsa_arctica.AAC.1
MEIFGVNMKCREAQRFPWEVECPHRDRRDAVHHRAHGTSCTQGVADAAGCCARTRKTGARPTSAGAPRIFMQASLCGCREVQRRAEVGPRLRAEGHWVARR